MAGLFYNGPAGTGENAAERARVLHQLSALGANSQATIERIIRDNGWTITRSRLIPPHPVDRAVSPLAWYPRSYYCDTDANVRFVFCLGVEDDVSANWLADGYASPNSSGPPTTFRNDRFQSATGSWEVALGLANAPWPETHFAGHSAGGTFSMLVAGAIHRSQQGGLRGTVTMFGAPKWAHRFWQTSQRGPRSVHWINFDDPVPLIPPRYTSFNRIILWYGTIAANNFQYFSPWYLQGRCLQGDGTVHEVDEPDGITGDPFAALTTWLNDTRAGNRTGHSIATYYERLNAAYSGSAGGGDFNNPPPDYPLPPVLPLRTAVVTANQVQRANSEFASGRESTPPVIPPQQAFSTSRTGRTWWVLFGDIPVAVGPHRRGAHQLARLGNAFLRSMQTRGCVLADDFLAQFTAYIAAASDPSSQFKPTMQLLPQ